MKHSQEASKSDLQAVKIRLGHFLEMLHMFQVDPNSILYLWHYMTTTMTPGIENTVTDISKYLRKGFFS